MRGPYCAPARCYALFSPWLPRICVCQEESYIFMETAVNFHQHRHTYIECIPMEKEIAMDAPLFFSKVRQTTIILRL